MQTQETKRSQVRGRVYNQGRVVQEDFELSQTSELLEDSENIVWVDLTDPSHEDIQVVVDELGLHPLAVEDALHPHQRPKVDKYEHHLFVTLYLVSFDTTKNELTTLELNAFVTKNALVTVHRSGEVDIEAMASRWSDPRRITNHGVAVLLHGLIDYAVDDYFSVVQELDDELDGLEDILFDIEAPARDVQHQSFRARKSLANLRRVVLPMREVVSNIMRDDLALIDDEMQPYYQDVFDHVLRAIEWVDNLRELVSTVLETNLSIQSNRLNDVVRKLTAWTLIIAVPTAITGYFGQNIPYPGSERPAGFLVSTLAILLVGGAIAAAFRIKRWL